MLGGMHLAKPQLSFQQSRYDSCKVRCYWYEPYQYQRGMPLALLLHISCHAVVQQLHISQAASERAYSITHANRDGLNLAALAILYNYTTEQM
jgi:hypothetical protein